MASVAEILLAQGRHAAETRRAKGGVWMPLVQSLANLPNQISADRAAERQAAVDAQDAQQRRDLTSLQMARTAGELQDQETGRTNAAREQQIREAMLDVLNQPDIVTAEGFDLPKARQYAESKGYGQLLAGALIEADREQDAAALERGTKEATLARIRRQETEAETAARQATNQQGVRRMIGESIAARGGQPITDADRQQITGMAFQEGVDLPQGLIPEPERPDARSLNIQLADAIKRGDMRTASAIRQAMRESEAIGRPPAAAVRQTLTPNMEANVIRQLATQWTAATAPARELDRQVSIMDEGIRAARAGNLNAGGQAVLVTFQKILDPTSVVRESEFDRSREGISLMQRAQGAVERMTRGGPGVPLPELEQFARLAREIAAAQQSSRLAAIQERIGRVADRYTIPRELVFDAPPPATDQPPPPPAGSVPPPRGGGAGPAGQPGPIIVDGFEVIPN